MKNGWYPREDTPAWQWGDLPSISFGYAVIFNVHWDSVYILLVSRSSLHLFAIKSLKLPRVIETSTLKDLQHALRRILTWMPSTRFFSMLKKCLNLRFQPVIYLDLNYKHGHFFKFNTLVSRSKTTMTLTDSNYQQQWISQVLNKALEIYNLQTFPSICLVFPPNNMKTKSAREM